MGKKTLILMLCILSVVITATCFFYLRSKPVENKKDLNYNLRKNAIKPTDDESRVWDNLISYLGFIDNKDKKGYKTVSLLATGDDTNYDVSSRESLDVTYSMIKGAITDSCKADVTLVGTDRNTKKKTHEYKEVMEYVKKGGNWYLKNIELKEKVEIK